MRLHLLRCSSNGKHPALLHMRACLRPPLLRCSSSGVPCTPAHACMLDCTLTDCSAQVLVLRPRQCGTSPVCSADAGQRCALSALTSLPSLRCTDHQSCAQATVRLSHPLSPVTRCWTQALGRAACCGRLPCHEQALCSRTPQRLQCQPAASAQGRRQKQKTGRHRTRASDATCLVTAVALKHR